MVDRVGSCDRVGGFGGGNRGLDIILKLSRLGVWGLGFGGCDRVG